MGMRCRLSETRLAELAIDAQLVRLASVVVVQNLQSKVRIALDEGGAYVGDFVRPPATVDAEHHVLDAVELQPVELVEPVRTKAAAFAGSRTTRGRDSGRRQQIQRVQRRWMLIESGRGVIVRRDALRQANRGGREATVRSGSALRSQITTRTTRIAAIFTGNIASARNPSAARPDASRQGVDSRLVGARLTPYTRHIAHIYSLSK